MSANREADDEVADNGETADRETADEEVTGGEQAGGEPADGGTTDGEAANEQSESGSDADPGRPTRRLRWRVTLGDTLLGAVCLAVGLTAGATAMGQLWWLAFVSGTGAVIAVRAVEWGGTEHLDQRQRLAVLGGALTAIVVAAAVALLGAGPDAIAAVALLGIGAGLLLYRFVFGVLLPIPRDRFRRIAERSV